jgi:3-methylfumaryl-CoA hydratase
MSIAGGSAVDVVDVFTLAQGRRVAAMLDLDAQTLAIGSPVPRGWHFAMLTGESPRSRLRSDGFPGLGIRMPQLNRPRLLLGQRITGFQGDIMFGAPLMRHSAIASIVEKTGRNGPLSIVRMEHSLSSADGQFDESGSVLESQTYYLAGLPSSDSAANDTSAKLQRVSLPSRVAKTVVTPDDVMLFQYSALGFNTHRIHFDRTYARDVEGHPDLVVNGGLATLLATEFLRRDLGKSLKTVEARHMAPLFVNRPLTILAAELTEAGGKILLLNDDGAIAAELGVTFDEL